MKFNLPHSGRSAMLSYGVALSTCALAVTARFALTPYIGTHYPYSTVFFAVIVSAWYGGLYPALLAAVLGFLGVSFFVLPPLHSFVLHSPDDIAGATIYLFISLSTALFSEAQHRAQARAEASAQEVRRQAAAVLESEARKSAVLNTSLDGIVTIDHKGRIVEFNPAAERMFGVHRSEAIGKAMADLLIPPRLREQHRRGMTRYAETGEAAVLGRRIEMPAWRSDGTEFPVELAICRIPGDGPPMFSGQIHDITARKRTEIHQRFLADASNVLASSLDFQTTLQSVAQLAVPRFADWCAVDMPGEGGEMARVAVSHADPAKVALAHELDRRYPPNPNSKYGAGQVMRTGIPEVVADMPDEVLRAGTVDDEHYRIVKELGLKSYLCVPLSARDRYLGAITFIGAESGQRYTEEDLPLALELARRAAIAVDNALLFRAERERSSQLTMAIQEVHHRVKNNLQAVSALLEMQIDSDCETLPVDAVQDSLRQIKTIALVHDLLTHDKPMGRVDATQVLTRLVAMVSATIGSPDNPSPISLSGVPMPIPVRAATALALAINELLYNSAKHFWRAASGGPARRDLRIQVCVSDGGESVEISVQDNGPGLPPGFDSSRDAHVGLELVHTLVSHDLRGRVVFRNSAPHGAADAGGARVEIVFRPSLLSD